VIAGTRRKYKRLRGTNKHVKGNAGILKIIEVQVEMYEEQRYLGKLNS